MGYLYASLMAYRSPAVTADFGGGGVTSESARPHAAEEVCVTPLRSENADERAECVLHAGALQPPGCTAPGPMTMKRE